jgi:4-carboxymuconolactone decarboxylase
VDRAVANTDDFNRQFQELLTTYCWGAVWGDDALKPRERSILNLGMIACLGRMHEFEAHFRGSRCGTGLRRTSYPQSCGR